jgi:hypothetical protein
MLADIRAELRDMRAEMQAQRTELHGLLQGVRRERLPPPTATPGLPDPGSVLCNAGDVRTLLPLDMNQFHPDSIARYVRATPKASASIR